MSGIGAAQEDINTVRRYHERTKHHLHRYARALGYLDWTTQPDPFRHYAGAKQFPLILPEADGGPEWDEFVAAPPPPRPADREALSELFYYSLALSAWKEEAGSRWSLRVNPSSGDLHPTEAYLIAGPLAGVNAQPGLYHYAPLKHALELRLALTDEEWAGLARGLPAGSILVALASIPWREAWKYGERAFRYCQHDAGHAIACLAYSARLLGWQIRVVSGMSDSDLDALLGLRKQRETTDVEAEHPDCLLALAPWPGRWRAAVALPGGLRKRLATADFNGTPNRLSVRQHPWPEIEKAATAARCDGSDRGLTVESAAVTPAPGAKRHTLPARRIIRQRRSAVGMDGRTTLPSAAFYRILSHLAPALCPFPHEAFYWPARVSLAFFRAPRGGAGPGPIPAGTRAGSPGLVARFAGPLVRLGKTGGPAGRARFFSASRRRICAQPRRP